MKSRKNILTKLITIICIYYNFNAFGKNNNIIEIDIYKTTKKALTTRKYSVGKIILKESKYGILIIPNVYKLPAGAHGLHIHENYSCEDNGIAAGSHWDPDSNKNHLGPHNDDGHKGDLPVLYIQNNGNGNIITLAPKIKNINELHKKTLIIHEGGDNYTDNPALGGGGKRIACGLIN